MRLIDVDKLIDAVRLHEIGCEKEVVEIYEAFIRLFEIQPTAYNVDAVVEELEWHSFEFRKDILPSHYVRLNKAIEIVKRGGKNED